MEGTLSTDDNSHRRLESTHQILLPHKHIQYQEVYLVLLQERRKMKEVLLSFVVIFGFLFASFGWKVFNAIWLRPKKIEKFLRNQGLKGPSYKLFYGNAKEIALSAKEAASKPFELSHSIAPRVLPFLHEVVKKYGETSLTWFGPTPTVIVTNPDMIKEIFCDKSRIFGKTKSNPFGFLLVRGLVTYEGDKWAKHRRIINPAFQLEKLKLMLPAFQTCCSELVNKWQSLATSDSYELDVWPDLENLTANVISRTAFGSSYEEGSRIFQVQTEQAGLFMQSIASIYIPGSRFLPTKRNKQMVKNHNEIRSILTDLILKREKAMKAGEANNNDLLGLLLESNLKEVQDNANSKKFGMSIDEVIEECKLFYFAGADSTSNFLAWTMICLSIHQDWQERAREEVMQVFGRETPNLDGLSQLKIVTMIMNEVLRLYTPVVYLNRTNNKQVKLGEITFPPGVVFRMPMMLVHHDRELWGEDVDEFKPERFSEGVSKATKNRAIFFPFNLGPRVCIGQNYAMTESRMAIAMILQNFSFELSPSYRHAPCVVATLKPEHGIPLILHKL